MSIGSLLGNSYAQSNRHDMMDAAVSNAAIAQLRVKATNASSEEEKKTIKTQIQGLEASMTSDALRPLRRFAALFGNLNKLTLEYIGLLQQA
jgi:hypothetical protein